MKRKTEKKREKILENRKYPFNWIYFLISCIITSLTKYAFNDEFTFFTQ